MQWCLIALDDGKIGEKPELCAKEQKEEKKSESATTQKDNKADEILAMGRGCCSWSALLKALVPYV